MRYILVTVKLSYLLELEIATVLKDLICKRPIAP